MQAVQFETAISNGIINIPETFACHQTHEGSHLFLSEPPLLALS